MDLTTVTINSTQVGTNRFATIFLYLTDVEEGGETVFIHAAKDGANTTTSDGNESKTAEEVINKAHYLFILFYFFLYNYCH